jgi:threonine dehydratase
LSAVVVVPENNNPVKNRAIVECGAELIEAGASFEEAAHTVDLLCKDRSLYYAHPANEPLLINGVGTEFLEIAEDLPDIDVMVVPIGAGSEAAAAITVLRAFRSDSEIIAVQAKNSPAAYHAWLKKEICHASNTTFAGGFATGKAYEVPFEIYKNGLDDFVLLTDDEIYDAIGLALFYTHNLTEGAGAASIMAAYRLKEKLAGKRVVLQMSGCNASPDEIIEASRHDAFAKGVMQ